MLDAPRQAVSHSHRIACCWASRLPVVHADRQGSAGVHPLAWLHAWDIRSRAEHSALAQGYSPVNRRRLVRKAVEHERSSRWRRKPILKSDWQATESFSSRSPGMAVARGACVTLPCASHICVLRIDGTCKTPIHIGLPYNSQVEPALRQRLVWARLSAGLPRKTVPGRCLFPRHTGSLRQVRSMRGDAAPHSFENTLIFFAPALHVSTGFASTQSEYYGEQVPGWPPTRTVFLSDTTRYLNVTRREKFDQSQPGRQQRAGLCFGVFDE